MSTPVIFPDVELVLCQYLRNTLPNYGYPVQPADPEGVFVSNKRGTDVTAVWVRRDGGSDLDQVREEPRVSINVFDPDDKRAGDLARTVAALVRAAADGDPILRVEKNSGPAGVADGVGPRRFMSFDVAVRGIELTS